MSDAEFIVVGLFILIGVVRYQGIRVRELLEQIVKSHEASVQKLGKIEKDLIDKLSGDQGSLIDRFVEGQESRTERISDNQGDPVEKISSNYRELASSS